MCGLTTRGSSWQVGLFAEASTPLRCVPNLLSNPGGVASREKNRVFKMANALFLVWNKYAQRPIYCQDQAQRIAGEWEGEREVYVVLDFVAGLWEGVLSPARMRPACTWPA